MLKYSMVIFCLVVMLFACQCTYIKDGNRDTNAIQNEHLDLEELAGEWEVYEQYENNKKVTSITPCNDRNKIQINKIAGENEKWGKNELSINLIGRSNYSVCIANPITYEYSRVSNSCYNTIYQATTNPHIWYEIGEEDFKQYKVRYSNEQIILIETNTKAQIYLRKVMF